MKPDVLQGGLKENIYASFMLLYIIFNFLLEANFQRNPCHMVNFFCCNASVCSQMEYQKMNGNFHSDNVIVSLAAIGLHDVIRYNSWTKLRGRFETLSMGLFCTTATKMKKKSYCNNTEVE